MIDYKDIGNFYHCEVKTEGPSNKIYDFNGSFIYPSRDKADRELQEPLTLENTLWADTVLASQGFILGLVCYTGMETRSQMNKKQARSKMSLLDMEVNTLSKILFSLMIFLAGAISVLNGFHGDYMMFFFRCILLLSSIIPISLRVNLDLAKLYYSYMINNDTKIKGTITRNSNIPEDLGRLSYLITDKTGTLTQNEMILKKVCTEFAIFESDDPNKDFENILNENVEKFPEGPCNDVVSGGRDPSQIPPSNSEVNVSSLQEAEAPRPARKKRGKRDQGNNVRDLTAAFAICNNVTPVADDPGLARVLEVLKRGGSQQQAVNSDASALMDAAHLRGAGAGRATLKPLAEQHSASEGRRRRAGGAETKMILQASSPDEVALVEYSNSLGMELVERDRTSVQLRNPKGVYENYDILANFPFTS